MKPQSTFTVCKWVHDVRFSLLSRIMWFYLSSRTPISSGPWIHLEPEKDWTFCFVSCSWRRIGQRSSPSRLDSEIYQETWPFSPQILSDPAKDSHDHMLEAMKHFTWVSIFYNTKTIKMISNPPRFDRLLFMWIVLFAYLMWSLRNEKNKIFWRI